MVKQQSLALLALVACVLAVGVIALGAYTRLNDAGLGCPDWPGCYGQVTVPQGEAAHYLYNNSSFSAAKAWAEMLHRYFAGSLTLLLIGIFFVGGLLSVEQPKRSNILLLGALALLLLYQIALGRWTVTLKLLPIIVTQHLLGGLGILSLLWLLYLSNRKLPFTALPNNRGLRWGAGVGLALVLLQLFLGAWTSTNYASLSCPDFPFCHNSSPSIFAWRDAFHLLLPAGVNYQGGVLADTVRQSIQMAHRIGAMVVSIYLLGFGLIAQQQLRRDGAVLSSLNLIMVLVLLQLSLGMAGVVFQLPLSIALAHTLVAAGILLSLITFNYRLYR
ncbi:MAG: hypothetical protein CMF50_04290 [Legionellales bacterium]|nr:hypothetical protein [Legionellales bacterium]